MTSPDDHTDYCAQKAALREAGLKPKWFLVTGCGRSGTRYTSDLFSELGLAASWEFAVNPMVFPEHRARDYIYTLRRHHLWGDCNWLAVPYLKRIPRNVLVFHQTRHPLKVIRSLLALRFFGDDTLRCGWRGDRRHTALPATHLPGLRQRATVIERCMDYWCRWNELCVQLSQRYGFQYHRYRFEDLINPKQDCLAFVLKTIGGPAVPERIEWPKNKAKWFRSREGGEFTWDDLPDGKLKDSVRTLANAYGYPT